MNLGAQILCPQNRYTNLKSALDQLLSIIFIQYQGICQERKKPVLHGLGNNMQLGVWVHRELFNGHSEGPGGKALGKFTLFSLKNNMIEPFKK